MVKKRIKLYKDTFKPLTKFLKDLYAGKVGKVSLSQRVVSSPSVIVTSQFGNTANMERIMRSQTFADPEKLKGLGASRTMEINPRHPIIIELNKLVQESPDEQTTKDLAWLVYDTALLASGFYQDDIESFSDRMYRTIGASLNVKSFELAEELEIPAEEEEEEGEKSKEDKGGESAGFEGSDEF